MTQGFRDSTVSERWAARHLQRRRSQDALKRGAGAGQSSTSVAPGAEATLRNDKPPIAVEDAPPAAPPEEPRVEAARVGLALAREPLISCLCITENRHAFLPWLLWGYDRQTWARRELVIVDSSEPPLEPPERSDIRVVRAAPRSSLGAKRNQALDAARGELVAWFDDDDWQHPRRLSWLVEKLQGDSVPCQTTHAGPCRAWFVDLYGESATQYRALTWAIFNGSLFVRNNVREHRFREELTLSEDMRWLRDLRREGRPLLLDRDAPPVFFWLCHDSNVCNPRTIRNFERPLGELRVIIGADWGDTDAQFTALRDRLGRSVSHCTRGNGANAEPNEAPATSGIETAGGGGLAVSGDDAEASADAHAVAISSRPSLWVVTPCMGRLSYLRQTVPSVLECDRIKYCLVDYSCPDACGDWLEETYPEAVEAGRCVVERVVGKPRFNKCAAHNAGARRATDEGADYLCFLDADTVVEDAFFDWLVPRLEPRRFLIAGLRPDGYDVYSLTGLLVVSTAAFVETYGFDESFRGWGSEDIEMRLRLHVRHHLSYADVPLTLMRPIQHDNVLRSAHYDEKNIHRSDQRNYARLVKNLRRWRREGHVKPETADRLFFRPPPVPTSNRGARSSWTSPPEHGALGAERVEP
jgi:glycosyltransferase involved in cell wall biosynthesis